MFEEGVKATEGYKTFTANFPCSEDDVLYKIRGPFVSITGQLTASTLVPVHIRESEDPIAWSANFRVLSKEAVEDARRVTQKWYNSLPACADDIDEDDDVDDGSTFVADSVEGPAETEALRRGRDIFLKGCAVNCQTDFDVTETTWKVPKHIEALLGCCIRFELTTDQFDRGAQTMHDFLLK